MYRKTYSKKSRKKVKFAWLKNPQEKLKKLVFLPTWKKNEDYFGKSWR